MKQTKLFDNDCNVSWFEEALINLSIGEQPGWPDKFGDHFHNWVLINRIQRIKTLSLFSGGGGLDIAFHDMGFEIVECVEIEKDFAATLIENSSDSLRLSGTKVLCKDIRDYSPKHQDIQFIIGGPPCQTFSAAGARASGVNGTDDCRGKLFEEYVRILMQTKPLGFLFENVYRIVGAQDGKPWKQILEAFRAAGYKLFWRILDAADYGVPQHRERLIIVGVRDANEFKFPKPSHGPDSTDNRPYHNAGLAVSGIDTSKCAEGIGGRHGHLLNEIPPGLNYSYYTERMGHPKPIFGWRSKFSDYLYKADPQTPVRTIKAQGGQYTGPFSWENRTFTIEEIKRLQTFPDNYVIRGGRQTVVHQLGNSVPPQIGRVLAASILNQIFGVILPFKIEYLAETQKLGFRTRKSALTAVYKKKADEHIKQNKHVLNKVIRNQKNKSSGETVRYLTNDFRLLKIETSGSSKFNFKFDFNDSQWKVLAWQEIDNSNAFSISIELTQLQQNLLGTRIVYLESSCISSESLLALWKFFEEATRDHTYNDDLIQFFGYYQYRQIANMKMTVDNNLLENNHFWNVISQVSNGLCIGKTLHVDELCDYFKSNKEQLKEALVEMKSLGFEIRNHNTNKQIKTDHYLIPYAFPTLNERSLQRLTVL
ncbi:MAG: DNA cytosine methyltransferase [Nitrosomonas sp.]|nr:MAG: DNA cytosine methyltransferase [Nitrosomonas sp.]